MRKILLTIILISSTAFAQNGNKSFLELRQKAKLYKSETITVQTETAQFERKKAGLAILYSMLLPGMGELYAQRYDVGKYFTIVEGGLWLTFAGLNIYGSQQEDNYKSYAQTYAGVTLEGKDDQFFADIGGYNSVYDFNDQKYLDRDFENVYDENAFYWQWVSEQNREEYKNTWRNSESAYNSVKFVVGAMILNRVVSAINAARLVSAYNRKKETELGWNMSFGIDKYAATLPMSYTLNFSAKL